MIRSIFLQRISVANSACYKRYSCISSHLIDNRRDLSKKCKATPCTNFNNGKGCTTTASASSLLSKTQLHYNIQIACINTTASMTTGCRPQRRYASSSSPSSSSSSSSLPHDIGGDLSAYGPVFGSGDDKPDGLLLWEQQCHALFSLLASKKILSTDGLRRSIEALTPEQYQSWTYYEKWTAAMVTLLMERGIVSHDEVSDALFGDSSSEITEAEPQQAPRFQTGDSVRVKSFHPETSVEWKRPHIRTPGYVYGVCGIIERVCGRHGDPSFLAFGLSAPTVQLYRVRFRQQDLWPEQRNNNNSKNIDDTNVGEDDDVVEVELYEHWLEHSTESKGHGYQDHALFDHSNNGSDCVHHHHPHDEDDDDHTHQPRPIVEERAVRLEQDQNNGGPPRPGEELFQALYKLLVHKKKLVTANEIRNMLETLDTFGKELIGSKLVAKAWVDPVFKQRLLHDAASAAKEIGVSTSNPNSPTVLTVVENTPTVHNLIVCTLCSCYPSSMLGIAPSWYKCREYRARAVREPRRVLSEEFGLSVSKETQIRVHDSTADHRYIVLPQCPQGTENWTEEQLRSIVTRDTMVGVAIPSLSSSSSPS